MKLFYNFQLAKPAADSIDELEEIGEPRGEMGSNLYLASQQTQPIDDTDLEPVYNNYIGLAVEPLKGFTLKNLFEVQTTT